MKRIINKLFEWLGYVPKDGNAYYWQVRKEHVATNKAVADNRCKYCYMTYVGKYIVYAECEDSPNLNYIKAFPYTNEDSKKIAHFRAKLLCEMLNEKDQE